MIIKLTNNINSVIINIIRISSWKIYKIIRLINDWNSFKISNLDICIMEIGLIVKINSLKVTCSNLCYDRVIEKGLIVNNNEVKSTYLQINGLEELA